MCWKFADLDVLKMLISFIFLKAPAGCVILWAQVGTDRPVLTFDSLALCKDTFAYSTMVQVIYRQSNEDSFLVFPPR